MLYDHKEFALPEVTLEPWRLCLLEAAERIRKYGWIKWKHGSEKMGYCMLGAIHSTKFPKKEREQARNNLRRYLGGTISFHNDYFASSVQEVLGQMDGCSKE